ncbi:hypothetical protein BGZ93_008066 [Podila epicladia]|nr:hypothetical protein BGZ92_009519 [Podila epicladia]KAG0099352.1 hypothetical protein BGZ93_008066 [Podila epicladia]
MLANKTFNIFMITTVFMLLAIVEAAGSNTCVPCPRPPLCNLECRGGYCIIDRCLCAPKCRKGIPPETALP